MSRAGLWSPLLLTLAAACGRDVAFVDPRAATEPGDTTNGNGGQQTVVRGNLDVTVTVTAEDTAIARTLGFTDGALPGAAITVRRLGQPIHRGTTDAGGRLRLEGLVTGPWTVTAVRPLTPVERAALPAGAEDVTAFGAGANVTVLAEGSALTLSAVAGRQGTVVISEVFPAIERTQAGEDYLTGQFVELTNNSFETVYLDGMVVGLLYGLTVESNVSTCEESARWREDSAGIWAREFASFPGDGNDVPLAAGLSVVIATDAIDHTPFAPTLLNLAVADFEFIGSADVDNPAVPNMVNTGLGEHRAGLGHGILFGFTQILAFVSLPVDPDTLPREVGTANQELVRIPRATVLDVLTSRSTPERPSSNVPCARMTHPVFDGQNAELYDYTQVISLRRRVLQALPDGRQILQRTRNSAADFESAPPSPGRVP